MQHTDQLKFPDAQILIFAKTPVIGRVKTRLIPHIGDTNALRLYQAMLQQTVETTANSKLCNVRMYCLPTEDHLFIQSLKSDYPIELDIQQGTNLGERMFDAASKALKVCKHVVLIGCDRLQFTAERLENVLSLLSSENIDAVITPAHDGGYVLLGLNRVNPLLFENIEWGTDSVMQQTCNALESLRWEWREMETLRDLDTIEDLAHIKHNEHQYHIDTGVREMLETIFEKLS